MAKILLVEDDKALSEQLADWLRKEEHHTVDVAGNGTDAVLFLETYVYDAVVLDWELPECSGIHVLRTFRQNGGRTPVLMLTGRASVSDKIIGLDTGSDDYLTKPFQPEELSARLRGLMRRCHSDEFDERVRFGKVTLDAASRTAQFQNDSLKLQPAEFDLLFFLATNPDQTFTAEKLVSQAWPDNERANPASLRVCISRLRKKIADEDDDPIIENLPGQGYRFNGTKIIKN